MKPFGVVERHSVANDTEVLEVAGKFFELDRLFGRSCRKFIPMVRSGPSSFNHKLQRLLVLYCGVFGPAPLRLFSAK